MVKSPERLEQEAERLGAGGERCLGNCATCAYKKSCEYNRIAEGGENREKEFEKSLEASGTEHSLKPKTSSEIVAEMRRAFDDDKIQEIVFEYINQKRPMQGACPGTSSNYNSKKDHFAIPV